MSVGPGAGNEPPAWLSASAGAGNIGSSLTELLNAPEIVPGSDPSYQLCKAIYVSHPLGTMLADAPITRAQAKPREISVPIPGEARIVEQLVNTWNTLGGEENGATSLLHNVCSTARQYGLSSLAVGEHGKDPSTPLEPDGIAKANLYFNILDPLNTAGSLVLNQDPNEPNFLKPSGDIRVNGKHWHPSRLKVKMNGKPVYIAWTPSAYGFVGRSVYQSVLYPMKTYLQSMITNQLVIQKAGLLIYKAQSPGSIINNLMQGFMGLKRAFLKSGQAGQVATIGLEEDISSINFTNLEKPFELARMNCIRDIASGAGMPASIVAQETLTAGFGEGTEDAKKEAEYLDFVRQDMAAVYAFVDRIVMRKAITPEFFETLKTDYQREYGKMEFATFFFNVARAFRTTWPNLLVEPDSEKVKTEEIQFKSAVALAEVMLPELSPAGRAKTLVWLADNANDRERLFASKLDIDEDEEIKYAEEKATQAAQMAEPAEDKEPGEPTAFSGRT